MLAPWFYRQVVHRENGPIVRLSVGEVETITGAKKYEALAYLDSNLRPTKTSYSFEIYGNADGTGTDIRHDVACHKAISEALERWAYYDLISRPDDHKKFGLDVDPSTTGFAAWPGLFSAGARRRANYEAIERWSLAAWWQGHLSHRKIHHPKWSAIEILTPFQDASTVVLFGQANYGHFVYGFAAGRNTSEAAARAEIELGRNIAVLANQKSEDTDALPMLERRLLYFANPAGHEAFQNRLNEVAIQGITERPRKLVDCAVEGPWSKYAKVWRVLYEPAGIVDEDDLKFFLF